MVTNIDKLADIETIEHCEIPGPHVNFDMLFEIKNMVLELAEREDISGIIITHGTDTLEETAYFLDLALLARSRCCGRRNEKQLRAWI